MSDINQEDEKVVEKVVEGEIVEEVSHETTTISIDEVEAAARAQGWDPEKGDLSGLEFLQNGRVFRDRRDELPGVRP